MKIIYFAIFFFLSCTIYEKSLDNPVDNTANESIGVNPPSLVFYPKTQSKTIADTVSVGAYLVVDDSSDFAFSGAHLNINYDPQILQFDSLKPGWIGPESLTDSNTITPLFTSTVEPGIVNVFAYYINTKYVLIDSLTHITEIYFSPIQSGEVVITYDTTNCDIVDYNGNNVVINGVRSAIIIIE